MNHLCGFTPEEMNGFVKDRGFKTQHTGRILTEFYRNRHFDINLFSGIPKELRMLLSGEFNSGILTVVEKRVSSDHSVKYLFRSDRNISFEAVFIPDGRRKTVCVSSQSGCRMGCPFCLTGRSGFRGNLTAGEIVSQVLSLSDSSSVTHVVFMGMGEPMDNLAEVIKACSILTAEWGLSLSPGNVTISTVGITPAVKEFLERTRCNITLSLYSPFPSERLEAVPSEQAYPAEEVLKAMKDAPALKRRRMSVAYVMISDVNDSERHLEGLKKLLKGSSIRVNILPYHTTGDESFKPSSAERMQRFRHDLIVSGISASVRKSRGSDISAACGLLAAGLQPR